MDKIIPYVYNFYFFEMFIRFNRFIKLKASIYSLLLLLLYIIYIYIYIYIFCSPCYAYNFSRVKQTFLWPYSPPKINRGNHLKSSQISEKCTCNNVKKNYDVIVIGGGHSGCEASYISAKSNAKTLLVTQNKETIGEMSCNPSIGGIGKGILVKEIDALGGLMGKVIDKSGIHFKILNMKKGLAVRGHRAQADRDLYNYYMKEYIYNTPNLDILENSVQSLLIETYEDDNNNNNINNNNNNVKKRIYGIKNKCSCEIYSHNVILTTGTFLGGICHIGKDKYKGGRIKRLFNNYELKMKKGNMEGIKTKFESIIKQDKLKNRNQNDEGTINNIHNNYNEDNKKYIDYDENVDIPFEKLIESSSKNIAEQLRENNFEIKRMKTGTPPRLDINSINFDMLEREDTEKEYPFYFSFLNMNKINNNKTLPCYKTYTNVKTHELVRNNLSQLPDYESFDKFGNGPRYCPSIAKKVMKFSEKKKHIIWIEPEGFNNNLIYPNGLSSAYPIHIQKDIINSIKGLENAQIIFPAYDVEYYYVNPKCLDYTLETKNVKGLFLAGQICGTTGYEEAACQGIIAGINAALNCKKDNNNNEDVNKFILKRNESYIGVLIHDLINKGITEPYRMFTSRAEYRLYLRPDNCDIRLTPKANQLGIVSKERIYMLRQKYSTVNKLIYVFKNILINEDNQTYTYKHINKSNTYINETKDKNIKHHINQERQHIDIFNCNNLTYSNNHNNNINNIESNIKEKQSETSNSYNKQNDQVSKKFNYINNEKNILNKENKLSLNTKLFNFKNNSNMNFIDHVTKNIKSLYNILKSGVEYPLNDLLHGMKYLHNQEQFKNYLLKDIYSLDIYKDIYTNDPSFFNLDDVLINIATLETACAEVKYSSYLKKQFQEIRKIKDNFDLAIPSDLKYDRNNFPYLSNEEIEKLNKYKPQSLYEANKIEGVTMSAVNYLYYHIKYERRKEKKS
ncbi:glucose inhibited division protein a homologue, putative [Plasmodium sp. gorilla clade G3]|nr:glucose inhibited division protein a homologue, putative [Plasmodium sp. gorilla clade G3]